jgi:hypothetical protein
VGAAGDETRAEELVAMGRSSEKLGRGLVAMKRVAVHARRHGNDAGRHLHRWNHPMDIPK